MLPAAIATAGAAYIWAATVRVRPLVYLLKPGTMLLIIWLAAGAAVRSPAPWFAWLVVAGLGCSLVGDVLLMLPRERFVGGLAAFLLAHLLYIGALWAPAPPRLTPAGAALAAALLLVAFLVFRRLAAGIRVRGKDRLLAPVALYILVISLMVWQALGTLLQPGPLPFPPGLVAAGALLFYLSDAALAWDRFVRPLPWRHAVVMGTYFAAQYCWAAAVALPPG